MAMSSKYLDDDRQARQATYEYDFDDRLGGRRILVSGGTGGLGSAAAARMIHAGADVVIGYASGEQRAQVVKEALEARYRRRVEIAHGDITTDEGRRALMSKIVGDQFYGAIICVGDPARIPAESLDMQRTQESMAVNYTGPILLARDCVQELSGRQIGGSVVLLSSMQGVEPFPGSLAYSGPKAALVHAARILAQEYGGSSGLRVNVVAPGVTDTGMALASIQSGKYDRFVDENVIPRFGYPEDVARAVAFFMAPDNYVTGQVLLVDGGLTLRRGVR
jgi:NAD(P)-dependent dehydrogenase (short-subunit alcohol dehydrogenase family)